MWARTWLTKLIVISTPADFVSGGLFGPNVENYERDTMSNALGSITLPRHK
jgi:hypothetical protein